MPNYDFHCNACDHEFEQNVPFDDRDKPLNCPQCGKKKVIRLVSVASINYEGFKDPIKRAGAGWNEVLKKVKKSSGRKNSIRTL